MIDGIDALPILPIIYDSQIENNNKLRESKVGREHEVKTDEE